MWRAHWEKDTYTMDFLHTSPFYEIAALLTLAATLGFMGLLLRQPMIVSFIAVGVLASPSGLNIVQSHESIDILAELGIAVLLFLVGLKLDLKLVRTLGPVSLATGLGQVFFTAFFGFFIGLWLDLDMVTSLYVAVALTFSSTIIIVKLLSDKKEVDALHGRIAIGFLIVQDVFVVFAMMILSTLGVGAKGGGDLNTFMQIASVVFYALLMIGFVMVFIRYIAIPLVSKIAHSSELLIVFAIGWASLLAAMGYYFGLSKELGGLLAGVSLASTPFREAIIARLSSLRDFLLLFFFIALGTQLDLSLLGDQIYPALIFSVFVLIGNPIIVLAIMGYMGYRKRTSFLAGMTVAQISEFSLIFMAMGVTLGHVSSKALGLVTLVGLITIALSVYMITYSHRLYSWFEPILGIFERKTPLHEEAEDNQIIQKKPYDVILFGLGRYGSAISEHLKIHNIKHLSIDFNPDQVRHWKSIGYDAAYGDACDHEFIGTLPLKYAKWVIAAMPQHDLGVTHQDPRLILMDGLKQEGFQGKIAISTQRASEKDDLKSYGATLVFLPFRDASRHAVEQIRKDF
jgi:Kef-type K+ transport system membrane component KefB